MYALPVLQADYDFKIARQDYELAKYERILHYLFRQKSRNDFLKVALECEMRRLQETFFLINALRAEMKNLSDNFSERIVSYLASRTIYVLIYGLRTDRSFST